MVLRSMILKHSRFRNASYILMGLALFVVLYFHFYRFACRHPDLRLHHQDQRPHSLMRRRMLARGTFLHKSLNAHNINLISTILP